MGVLLDSVPESGIARVRDMMYGVPAPFRLDQGDVSFDVPESVKEGVRRAISENHTHYLPTAGVPRLRELLAEKLVRRNGIPIGSPDEVLVTQGGIHAMYLACQALLEPGDEVIVPDPTWPSVPANVLAARAIPVGCPLRERLGYRFDLDELARAVTPRTRAIYVNSPHNPTGGVLTRTDIEGIAALARRHGLWLIADEAYEDVVFDGARHECVAAVEDAYERTLSLFTFSKTYAMTGVRLGYLPVSDAALRDRMRKLLFLTVSNTSSVVQYAGIGALEGPQDCVEAFRRELEARRDLFYGAIHAASRGLLSGERPLGAFYAFLRIHDEWQPSPSAHPGGVPASRSWALVSELIGRGRVGCVPGVDFGLHGENHVRFCFCRSREELTGALASMETVFAGT